MRASSRPGWGREEGPPRKYDGGGDKGVSISSPSDPFPVINDSPPSRAESGGCTPYARGLVLSRRRLSVEELKRVPGGGRVDNQQTLAYPGI